MLIIKNYKITAVVFILLALFMTLVQYLYIYPSFRKELIKSYENEALRTGNYLKNSIIKISPGGKLSIIEVKKHLIGLIINDLGIMKLKLFSSKGEITYSTSPDEIGTFNKRPYFHNIVAKGETFTKVVLKNSRSMEDKLIRTDVVETYVPIISGGKFIGAFEIYYDITVENRNLNGLIRKTSYILFSLGLLLLISTGVTYNRSKKYDAVREKYETKLKNQANTDVLTGLYNRRYFIEHLEHELLRSQRYKHVFSIIIIDIDHFKLVNDTYGHLVGDDVLKIVSGACRGIVRKTDVCARYGGEEFIFFLPETDMKSACLVGEKLRHAIESYQFPVKDSFMNLSISAGVSELLRDTDKDIESIISRADKALYQAKEGGRNRVVCFNS